MSAASADEVVVQVDRTIFPIDVVQTTAHRYTATHFVDIYADGDLIEIRFRAKGTLRFPDLSAEFRNALLDDKLRLSVATETRTIREELIKAALRGTLPRDRT